jgi:hypothetical protein
MVRKVYKVQQEHKEIQVLRGKLVLKGAQDPREM